MGGRMKTITTVPSTISEIVESIVLLAHAKGVAGEGFVNVDFYVEQLEKEVEKRLEEQRKEILDTCEIIEFFVTWDFENKKATCADDEDTTFVGGLTVNQEMAEQLWDKPSGHYAVKTLCTLDEGQMGEYGRWEIERGMAIEEIKITTLEINRKDTNIK